MSSTALLAFVVGFGVKPPLSPFHTWLPPAHADAPGLASAILAGVLLRVRTYGLVRMPFRIMPQTFVAPALPIGVVVVSSSGGLRRAEAVEREAAHRL